MSKLIVPQWPLPKGVAACSSTRIGGVSLPPYDSLNLGAHCGDNPAKTCLSLLANLMPQNEQMPLIAIRLARFAL